MSAATETFALTGPLTLSEVPSWSRRLKKQPLPKAIDLSAVEKADSSALALLLEIQSTARSLNESIAFNNPPPALQTLARLSGVSELLGWTNNEKGAHSA